MRRPRVLALVVAVAAALVPLGGVRAADQFVLYGSGWGHGLGLSQWGAYGLARAGWNHTRILTHFYTGTKIVRDADAPTEIRVELTAGRRRIHLRAEGGPVRLWTKSPLTGTAVGTIPAGDEWIVVAADSGYRVVDATSAVV